MSRIQLNVTMERFAGKLQQKNCSSGMLKAFSNSFDVQPILSYLKAVVIAKSASTAHVLVVSGNVTNLLSGVGLVSTRPLSVQ